MVVRYRSNQVLKKNAKMYYDICYVFSHAIIWA